MNIQAEVDGFTPLQIAILKAKDYKDNPNYKEEPDYRDNAFSIIEALLNAKNIKIDGRYKKN